MPESFHTEPEGNPAELVGMFFIERLFTKVAHALSDVKFEPMMNESQNVDVVLHLPPKIAE